MLAPDPLLLGVKRSHLAREDGFRLLVGTINLLPQVISPLVDLVDGTGDGDLGALLDLLAPLGN